MDSSPDSLGIDVPESELGKSNEEPIMQNDTCIGVDIAKAALEVAVSDIPGRVLRTARCGAASSWSPSRLSRRRRS